MFVTRKKYNDLVVAADAAVGFYRELWLDLMQKTADYADKNRALAEELERCSDELEESQHAITAAMFTLKGAASGPEEV